MAIGFFIQTAEEYEELGTQVICGAFFGENISLILNTGGYWDTATEMKPLMHLWTLAVEEQYYIFYPLIFFACFKFRWGFGKSLLVLWVISFALNMFQYKTDPIVVFYSLHTRFWELCTGALLANISYKKEGAWIKAIDSHRVQGALSILGLVLIVYGCFRLDGNHSYPGWRALIPTVGGGCLIMSGKSWINKHILSLKPIVFIGLISYTWYLWHWPFMAWVRQINGGNLPEISDRWLLIALGFICSLVSYFLIEQPIRRRHISKTLISLLCIGVVMCTGAAWYIITANGIPDRIPDMRLVAQAVNKTPYTTESCQREYDYKGAFCWSTKKGENTIAILGDSHAYHLASGFRSAGKPFVILAQHATPPLLGLVRPDQERTWKEGDTPNSSKAFEQILNDPNIKTVILSARWSLIFNKKVKLVWTKHGEIADKAERFKVLLREGIQKLLGSGKRVILMKDVPYMGFKPTECLGARPISSIFAKRKVCGISLAEAEDKSATENKILDDVAKEFKGKVVLYDPKTALCPKNFCWSIENGNVFFRDAGHLSDYGSSFVVNDLLRKFPIP